MRLKWSKSNSSSASGHLGLFATDLVQRVAQLDDAAHRRHIAGDELGRVHAIGLAGQATGGNLGDKGQALTEIAFLLSLQRGVDARIGQAGARLHV